MFLLLFNFPFTPFLKSEVMQQFLLCNSLKKRFQNHCTPPSFCRCSISALNYFFTRIFLIISLHHVHVFCFVFLASLSRRVLHYLPHSFYSLYNRFFVFVLSFKFLFLRNDFIVRGNSFGMSCAIMCFWRQEVFLVSLDWPRDL